MKVRLAAFMGVVLLVAPGLAGAQFRDWLSENVANNGSTVVDLLNAVERAGPAAPAYRDEQRRLRSAIGLVFVPGILGSALESPSKGKIWGYGMPDPDLLRLPRELIDFEAASDVRATIAERVLTVDLYGEAMTKIRASATRAGIPPHRIVACGYDWRRDIRAGARDLKRCIETSPELPGVDALVVVAHSMGGLVTWQWHREFAANGATNGVPVIAVAILGSPLAGSCEIVRMIEAGYQQPTANDRHARESWLSRFWTDVTTMKDRATNAVSSLLTQDIRTLVLTWPGAIALSPPPAENKDQPNCAPVPLNPDDGTDPRVLSHYQAAFWTGAVGTSLLGGKPLPETYTDVLEGATAFRTGFKLEPIASPTYLFASEIWDTPMQARLVPPTYVLDDRGGWQTVDGDGRMPFNAAVPTPIQAHAADALRVYSVHGNLPEDRIFHDEFFGQRLPRVLNGWIATRLMVKAAADPAFLKAYAAAGGRQVHPYDMHGSYERQSERNQRDPIYRVTIDAWNAAIDFNDALCTVSACPDYTRARTEAKTKSHAEKAAVFSAALRSEALSDDEATFIIAKRGLAMANQLNWLAAIGDLRKAVPALEARRRRLGNREQPNERRLRIDATANLGRALAMRGFCAEAEPYLRRTASRNAWAASMLKAPCFDRESAKIVSYSRPRGSS